MTAGALRERVRLERPAQIPDGRGGQTRAWAPLVTLAAEFRYERGREAQEPGGRSGSASFKVRLRQFSTTRALTTEDRVVDVRTGAAFNVREIDVWTDPQWVWLAVEGGVAT